MVQYINNQLKSDVREYYKDINYDAYYTKNKYFWASVWQGTGTSVFSLRPDIDFDAIYF
jgi:hypothetical protein